MEVVQASTEAGLTESGTAAAAAGPEKVLLTFKVERASLRLVVLARLRQACLRSSSVGGLRVVSGPRLLVGVLTVP